MIYKEEQLRSLLCGKRMMIAGYGREGKSTAALLHRLLPDAAPVVAEGNEAIRREAAKGYDLIVKSPGIPTAVFEGCCDLATLTSQTDLFLQTYGSQTIGVTGTKGKSTTTTLIAAVLQHHYGSRVVMAGNMGIPLFDVLDQLNEESIVVCEFSCHQLENIHRAPHVGVLLNLFQEHLDHYHSYRDYQMAKMNIGLKQTADDYFFYCKDNEELAQRVAECCAALAGHVEAYDSASAARWSALPRHLQGAHNLSNIEVACRVCRLMGVDEAETRAVVQEFQGLEHRLELVGTYRGITFYNDSISTIPEACMAAVEALQEVETLILGGYDRGIDYGGLARYLRDAATRGGAIKNIVCVGQAGRRIFSLLAADGTRAAGSESANQPAAILGETSLGGRRLLIEDDYEKIVPWCFAHTDGGKICLLSPAAASYDAFKNFEERGRRFKALVVRQGAGQ